MFFKEKLRWQRPQKIFSCVRFVLFTLVWMTTQLKCFGSSYFLDLWRRHPLIRGRVAEATGPVGKPWHLSPQAFTGQKGHIISPASPGSALGPPPSRMCLENLQREATRRHPNQMPGLPQLTPFNEGEQQLYSELFTPSLRLSPFQTLVSTILWPQVRVGTKMDQ